MKVYIIPTPDKPLKVVFKDSVSIEKGEGEFEYIITKKTLLTDEEIELLKELINNVSPI